MLRTIAVQTSWVEPYPPNAKCRTSSSQSGRLIPENTIVTDTAMQQRIAIPARCARRDGDPTSTVVAAFMMDACATRSSAKPLPVPECNNRTPNPRTRNQVKINTPCCVAKAVHYARSHPSARRTPGPIALGAQGLRTHLPTIQKTIRHARQLRTVQAPLFPRYIFLVLDLGRDRWLSVWGTPGVSSLFTSENRPVPVQLGPAFGVGKGVNERNARLLQRNMAC